MLAFRDFLRNREVQMRIGFTLARLAIVIAVAAVPAVVHAKEPRGTHPSSVVRPVSNVPNGNSFVARIWVPDIDAGFVPQGLAYSRGQLVLSAYRSTDPKQNRGPCRLFSIAPATGAVTGRLDLPPSCGHAGGVAALRDGRIVVADTHALYVVAHRRVTATIRMGGKLRGSFAAADSKTLWIGSYNRSGGTLWRLPLKILARSTINESHVLTTLAIPARVQGLVFDQKGGAWLTVSGSRDGALLKFDLARGRVTARYAMPAGIEDLAVDEHGLIWAVSEAGSIRWSKWPTNYPLLFAIDPARLQ